MRNYYSGVRRILRQLRWVFYPRRCPFFCDRVLGSLSRCPDCASALEQHRRTPTMRLSGAQHYLGRLDGAAAPTGIRAASGRPSSGQSIRVHPGRLWSWAWRWPASFSAAWSPCRGRSRFRPWCRAWTRSYDCILPVPASSRARGYNVPELMAQPLARAVGVPVVTDALVRARSDRRQEGLSLEERLVNVAGAFRVAHPEAVEGRRILLVDDVLTTGATAAACAQALLDAGAQSVFAVALATVEFPYPLPRTTPITENAEEI